MIDPVISVALRCVLAALFATAAWHKATDLPRFRATLIAYRLLPPSLGRSVAALVPGLELAIAVGLLLPAYRWAAYAATALLGFYSVAIAVNLARGRRNIDCGCFGRAARMPLHEGLLARNALLIACAIAVPLPLRVRPLVWVDALTVGLLVTVTILLWVSFWRLRQLARLRGGRR